MAFGCLSAVLGSAYLVEVRSQNKNYSVSNNGGVYSDSVNLRIKIISEGDSAEELRIKKVLGMSGIEINFSEKSVEKTGQGKNIIRYLPQNKERAEYINRIIGGDNVIEEVSDLENDIMIIIADDVHSE